MGVKRRLWRDSMGGNHERFMCFLCGEVARVREGEFMREKLLFHIERVYE